MTRETRTEVILFIGITLAISCGIILLYGYARDFMETRFGGFGPGLPMYIIMTAGASLTALGLTLWKEGLAGCANLLIRTFDPRGPWKWWLVALFGYPLLVLVYELIAEFFTLTAGLGKPGLQLERWYNGFPAFFYTFGPGRTGPILEEAGWRGYLLPRLLESMSPLRATIVVGLFWGLLHTPLTLALRERYSGNPGVFVVTIVFYSIIMSWIFMNSKGNVFLSGVLLHASLNASLTAGLGGAASLVIFGVTSFVLILLYGERMRPADAVPFVHRRHYRLRARPTDSGLPDVIGAGLRPRRE